MKSYFYCVRGSKKKNNEITFFCVIFLQFSYTKENPLKYQKYHLIHGATLEQ